MKRLRCLGSDDKVSWRKTKVQSIKVEVSWLGLYGRCVRVEVSGFICKASGNRVSRCQDGGNRVEVSCSCFYG